jgi:hypothetical protein
MDEKQALQTIHFKCDKTPAVIGRIVDENDLTVKMAVKMSDKMVNRMILRSKIEKIDQETNIKAINDEAAVALLHRAASEWQGQRAYDCLATVGQLYHEFADASILANEQAQAKATGLPSGLKALVGKAAAQFEGKCPCCIGSGKGVCPTCKGAQTIGGQRCDNCNHTGKVPCEVCDGKGNMLRKKDKGPAEEEDEATASKTKKKGDGQMYGKGTTKRVVFDMGSH